MNIFIIGGTGLVGSYLVPEMLKHGHSVSVLTRSEEKISAINETGARGIVGDIKNIQTFLQDLDKPDMVILLAMPNVKPGKRVTRKRKQELREETNDFFNNSIEIAKRFNASLILPGGTSYNTGYDEIADESWPISRVGLTEIGADTDSKVEEVLNSNDPPTVQLIYARIYGNGGLFMFMYNLMKKGRYRIIGKGNNYIPNIYAGDAANAIIKTIEKMPVGEKFIIADDEPVTLKDFGNHMAKFMNGKIPKSIPAFILRIVLGKDFYEIIKMNCKVSNEKAKKLLDWKPEYPSCKEGLEKVITEIEQEHFQ